MIDGKSFFNQPATNSMKTYDDIRKIQVKEMITQLVACWTIIISKNVII